MSRIRKRRPPVRLALTLGLGLGLLPHWTASPVEAGASRNDNACFQAATGTYLTTPVRLTGTKSPGPIEAGRQVTLSGASIQGVLDAAPFVSAYRLHLLDGGAHSVPATVSVTLLASNTVERTRLQVVPTGLSVTVVDPTPEDRASGDERALPAFVNLPLADTLWTGTGDTIGFTQGTVAAHAVVADILAIDLGPCAPSSGLTGCDGDGHACTGFTPDTNPTPFEASTVSPSADLQIIKTSGASVYKPAALVLYTIAVLNAGPDSASDAIVTDDLPLRSKDDLILLPDSECSIPDGGTLMTCSLGSIAPLETKRVHVSVRYRGARGLVQNTATVSSATFDPLSDNNASTNEIIVGPQSKQ